MIAMRFKYSTSDPAQDESDSLPRVPLILHSQGNQAIETLGLVDSGATVNVLPFDLGVKLGWNWDERKAIIRLAGSFGALPAMPCFAQATIRGLPPVRLAFAWAKSSDGNDTTVHYAASSCKRTACKAGKASARR